VKSKPACGRAQVREKNDKFQQRTLQSMFANLPLPSGEDDGGAAAELADMEDAVPGGHVLTAIRLRNFGLISALPR